MTEQNDYDVKSEDSDCPYCGKDLSTELVQNRRIIVGHPCSEKERKVEVAILNNPDAEEVEAE